MLVTPELSGNTNEDAEIFSKEGYGVDDDNDPDPEISPHLLQSMTSLRIMSGDLDLHFMTLLRSEES